MENQCVKSVGFHLEPLFFFQFDGDFCLCEASVIDFHEIYSKLVSREKIFALPVISTAKCNDSVNFPFLFFFF